MSKEVLKWVPGTDTEVLGKMFKKKLRSNYTRPSHLDIFAQQAIVISQRPTCLFYEVGAVIFYGCAHFLSSGYNGATSGDVDPREVGCARVVDGKIHEGKGLCRGSHAELNAIGNLTVSTLGLQDVSMIVTLHPCFSCAKQMVNKGIKKVYYIWEYGREEFVTDYFRERGVEVIKYTSPFLEKWIALNGYDPIGATNKQE
ncbi:MAG: CMP/dCMP deaminase zinc-binding protein [Parcubacteria group bacterium GW2011_GWC1_42_11]|uniref:CMP/dCMP deaminase zinc-binding protein n=1 Tax=Candidatus Nomurabacteria bacterium GW2011_GWC2_42_20 TaxID=1618756 RepID=A0A0G1BLP1_9BACT|nr:MAG: CMP/dCMP deaminase zinc-binding protein [Parcubacteria group bacterium GW2011_GWC1_42_11]KKS47186.1 MAG: CMP/dCMP deaminase zinc-binding protein [Candidatus Nomurabacteria bacterium GW2011_GWC2_42_20]TAN36564.1 MAG: cytidine deaminase [Patescibacteria group bacterium]HBH71717.1 cytidine deaminase [Candidatus Yonathbacteria bacterium]